MALKFINKLFGRQEQSTQSMIQPNDALNLDDLSKYTQVIATKETLGYKGLRRAFDEKLPVELTVTDENGDSFVVSGTISHYDEHYEQLLVITDSTLKRVVFNQITDVKING